MFHLPLQLPAVEPEKLTQARDSAKVAFEQFAQNLATNPSSTLETLTREAIGFGLKVLAAIVIYSIGAWLIKHIKKILARMFARKHTDKALASFITSISTIAMTIILIIITISTLGVNTTSLAALLAAGGMALGMALSGTAQNFAGGIMIMVFKPFKSGDYITAQGYAGTVTDVSIVSTTLTTPDNRVIVIPNGALFNGNIDNYSSRPLRRVEWKVGVSYGTDEKACKGKLLEIMNSEERILNLESSPLPAPADPFVALSCLGDSAVEFTLRAWVKKEDFWDVYFDTNSKIYTELPKAGIDFPFPQMDVHLHNS